MDQSSDKEFEEIVGTEYKEPEPIVFVLYRKGNNNVTVLNKKKLPADAIYMGKCYTFSEEWWSPEYFKERIKIEARK